MSQIEVTKQTLLVRIGSGEAASVAKLNLYARLVPGDGGGAGTSGRQAHVYAQIVRRP